ncbi:Uncharacterized protein ACO02O_09497 [Dirofilaria immitis]
MTKIPDEILEKVFVYIPAIKGIAQHRHYCSDIKNCKLQVKLLIQSATLSELKNNSAVFGTMANLPRMQCFSLRRKCYCFIFYFRYFKSVHRYIIIFSRIINQLKKFSRIVHVETNYCFWHRRNSATKNRFMNNPCKIIIIIHHRRPP